MTEAIKAGDKVSWDSSGGHSVGKVVRKITSPMKIKDHPVKASGDDPQYLVESDKSHKQAAHKPDALTKVGK